MKMKSAILGVAALLAVPAIASAQAPARNENLEPTCQATGSGMDPRCIGDSAPGTVSDMTTAREQRAIERGAIPAPTSMERDGVIIERR